jgi:tetratricopeptide (TPR) repeat protein
LSRCQGDLPQAIAIHERDLTVCHAWDLRDWVPVFAAGMGYAYALVGRLTEALPLLEQAVGQHAAMRRGHLFSIYVAWWSEAMLLAGRLKEAMQLAERALTCARDSKQRGSEAYALRLLGEIIVHCAPPEVEQAEAWYRQALALADELGMRPLQAHCHRNLGTLYATAGQREQARAELSTANALYCDMDMTFWLPQAEAALAQVKGQ